LETEGPVGSITLLGKTQLGIRGGRLPRNSTYLPFLGPQPPLETFTSSREHAAIAS